jgi:ankyrin repeat protein
MIKASLARKELAASFVSYCEILESLRANGWGDYVARARSIYPPDCLAQILRRDDLDRFEAIANAPGFQVDSRIETSIFEYASFLLRGPTLVQFCALSGAIRCFNFLVAQGANLTLRDSGKRILLHFAIAGGHPDIIHKATEVIDDFVVATRVSAEFHRFELFRTFLTTKDVDLKANDIENGSIFHGIAAANHIRMILFCIEQGCNVNLKDADGWSPLNCAIDFCALEAVLVLTSHVDIDVNGQDEYGITPLLRATMNGEIDVIHVLLKHPKLDINAEGLVFFALFMFRFSLVMSLLIVPSCPAQSIPERALRNNGNLREVPRN